MNIFQQSARHNLFDLRGDFQTTPPSEFLEQVAPMPLVLVGNQVKSTETQADEPRQDYQEIAKRLNGSLFDYEQSEASYCQQSRQLEKKAKLCVVGAFLASLKCSKHNAFLSSSEKMAIPLAGLLWLREKMLGEHKPHVVIAHKLSTGFKNTLFQHSNLHHSFSQVICVSRAQADYAINELDLPESAVHFVHDKVDHKFFHPMPEETTEDYILAVGQEQRDYETLLQAVAGTGLKVVIVASSPWSTYTPKTEDCENVTVLKNLPYTELRKLYAKARMVAVPLFDVDYAAGVNGVLEGMAMAKPVIVSQSKGISDYISDGETGLYVEPGNPEALRKTILDLWHQPAEQERLGKNARQAVEETMNLDIYVDRIVEIVKEAAMNN